MKILRFIPVLLLGSLIGCAGGGSGSQSQPPPPPPPPAPSISWTAPTAVVYGTVLSNAQLDATASIPGTFTYKPAAGMILDAGFQTLSVTFTPTDLKYTTATDAVSLTVTPVQPEIDWFTPAGITCGMPLTFRQLNAVTSIPGTFVYDPPLGTVLAATAILSVTFTPTSPNYTPVSAKVTQLVHPVTDLKGVVSINFDDGFESGYLNGYPIIHAAGFKSTQFVITQALGGDSYIFGSEMLAMKATGQEIGAHTRTHPHLDTLTKAQQEDEITGSQFDLAHDWNTPTKLFAYPYGDFNDTTVSIVKTDGFLGARTTYSPFNDSTSNALLLNCLVVDDGDLNDPAVIESYIDNAQANGLWLILLFHQIDETGNPISVSHEVLQAVVDYLVAQKTQVVTMTQGLAIYNLKP